MTGQLKWLIAGAFVIGVGSAMAVGSGVAAADTGSSGGTSSSSHSPARTSSPSAVRSVAKAVAASARPAAVPSSTNIALAKSSRGATAAVTTISSETVGAEVISQRTAHARTGALGASPRPEAVTAPAAVPSNGSTTPAAPSASNGVTGVKVGHSDLNIPCATCGANGYTAPADWYTPTQSDGSVTATGVIYLQHGFLADKSFYSVLATTLAQQTNSIVVAPTISSFPFACRDCTLNSVPMQQGVAQLFAGDRAALNISANAAGYQGTLPEQFILAGHSAGGGLAAAVGGYVVANGDAVDANGKPLLLGVVMFDGVSNGTFAAALTSLDTLDIPIYQIAAPPQAWNAFGQTTNQLVALHPNQFDGVVLVGGSHVDSALGSNPIVDFILQLFTQFSPPGNTAAVGTLSSGWINDIYVGAGPTDPQFGLYGQPGQPIILGPAAAIVLPTQPAITASAASARAALAT
jgi:hypothetical protein